MRAVRIGSRLPVGLSFLAVSGALFFRATEFYGAPWTLLAPMCGVFLALGIPWTVSAGRAWNILNAHALAWAIGWLMTLGIMIIVAMAASAHHAGDFTAHAVARTGTVTAVRDTTDTDDNGNTYVTRSVVSLTLTRPVAGQHAVVLRLPHDPGYSIGDPIGVLVDSRHPDDAELPGHQGWTTNGRVLGWIGAVALLGIALINVAAAVAAGPDSEGREPDFLDETWKSWTQWRAEPADFIPWTGAVRAAAWLPFFAITTLSVYAIVNWSQWWLLLLPGVLVAISSPVAATGRSYPRFRDAAWPLASLSVAAAAPVLLITGPLPPAAGVPLMALSWIMGVIATSRTGKAGGREPAGGSRPPAESWG